MLDSLVLGAVLICALQTDRLIERYRLAGKLSLKYIRRITRGIR